MPNQPKMIESECQYCKIKYIVAARELRGENGRKFCSQQCRYNHIAQDKYAMYSCHNCRVDFKKLKSRAIKVKSKIYFCSKKCQNKSASTINSKYKTGPKASKNPSKYRQRAINHYGSVCFVCGYGELEKLLDVDHVDNDRSNNKLSNLRVLCVFCHAMKTRVPDIFKEKCEKNGVEYTLKFPCKNCKKETNKTLCSECLSVGSGSRFPRKKIIWPSDEELKNLLQNSSFVSLSKILGVSGNAIKKRCIKRGIDYSAKART